MIIKTQLFCPAIHCTLWCLLAATSHADTNSITILTQPSAQTVNQGGAAAYSVAALGTPPLTYQWRFNMQGLLGATSSNLTITNVQATNIGFFDVVVSNQDGFVVSSPAALRVTGVFPERLALGLGAVPLGFVQNSGQSDPAVAFQASSLGAGTVFLMTDGHIQLALSGYDSLPACVRQIQYLGANPSPTVQALNPTVGSTTYLIGNNPGPWVTNLPDFAAIEYDQLYSGIAVSYSGTGRWLKSSFTVAPGSNPSQILWTYPNASSVNASPQPGNLVINFPVSTGNPGPTNQALELYAPSATQGANTNISVAYVTNLNGQIGFAVGGYDTGQPLTIESGLLFSPHFDPRATTLGGSNIYVAGGLYAATLPSAGSPSQDAFVAVLNSQGNGLESLILLGGTNDDLANGVAVDDAGSIYAVGETSSADFPVTGALQETNGGCKDGFIVKLDGIAHILLRGTFFGGPCCDTVHGILLSGSQLFVCGVICTNFPWSASNVTNFSAILPDGMVTSGSNYFLAELNTNLDHLTHLSPFSGGSVSGPVQIWKDANGMLTLGIGTYSAKASGGCNPFSMTHDVLYGGYSEVNDSGRWAGHALRWRSLVAMAQSCPTYIASYSYNIPPWTVDGNAADQQQDNLNQWQTHAIPNCNLNSSWDYYYKVGAFSPGYEAAVGAAMFMHYFGSPVFLNMYADPNYSFTVPVIVKNILFDGNFCIENLCVWPQNISSIQQLFSLDQNCGFQVSSSSSLISIVSVKASYWPNSPDSSGDWIVEDQTWSGQDYLGLFSQNGFPSPHGDSYVGDPPADQLHVVNHFKEATRQLRTSIAETITTAKATYQNGESINVILATNRVRAVDLLPAYLLSAGPFTLSVARVGTNAVLSWRAFNVTLEQADAITGLWTPVPSATSPYEVPATAARQFYRLRR